MASGAPGIFYRHVLRGMAAQTLIVALVLLCVLLVYQFSFVLGRAADGQIPGSTVPQLVLLSLRSNLGVILPFTVLLGVLLALGRLYYDSEIAAAQAAGVGTAVLYAAAATVVVPMMLLAGWVAFVDGPAAARDAAALRLAALRTAITRDLAPGVFRSLGQGTTLHFGTRDADGLLRDVFVQRDLAAPRDPAARMQVVIAERARFSVMPAGDAVAVEFLDGASYEGVPGQLDWRFTRFARQLLRVPVPQARLPGRPRVDAIATPALLGATDTRLRAELHWRSGWVLGVALLGLLAVPLARLRPRQGRHARIPLALLLFAVMAGLLTSGRTLLERGEIAPQFGLWWVHAAVLLLACGVLGMPRLATAITRRRTKR